MSSRNTLLSPEARAEGGTSVPRSDHRARHCDEARAALEAQGFDVEYVEERWGRRLAAVFLEGVRLIDNVPVRESGWRRLLTMLLALDVGNSQIFCGVYDGEELKTTFRRTSSVRASSDEFGTFFRATLRENGVDPDEIDMAGDLLGGAGCRALASQLLPEVLRL